jgi:hypothetical protein
VPPGPSLALRAALTQLFSPDLHPLRSLGHACSPGLAGPGGVKCGGKDKDDDPEDAAERRRLGCLPAVMLMVLVAAADGGKGGIEASADCDMVVGAKRWVEISFV